MSATKDFLMTVEDAKDYCRQHLSKFKLEIEPDFSSSVTIAIEGAPYEYDIIPKVRSDFPQSRELNGWEVRRVKSEVPTVMKELATLEEAVQLIVDELNTLTCDRCRHAYNDKVTQYAGFWCSLSETQVDDDHRCDRFEVKS